MISTQVKAVAEEPAFRDARETAAFLKARDAPDDDDDDEELTARPRVVVYHCHAAVGRESWTANLRLHDLADVANAPRPPPPAALLRCARPLFELRDDGDRDVRAALASLESHAAVVARLVRDSMLAVVADPDLEAACAVALRRFAAPGERG